MKLKSFRIINFKSIVDSGTQTCHLSNDNITILAGQNESGKSSILQALNLFDSEEISKEDYNNPNESVKIYCVFDFDDNDDWEQMFPDSNIINSTLAEKHLTYITSIELIKEFNSEGDFLELVNESLYKELIEFIKATSSDVDDADISNYVDSLISNIHRHSPSFIMFDDFCDLLPDKIEISSLKNKTTTAKGYKAVKNLEQILKIDFTQFEKWDVKNSRLNEGRFGKSFTAYFNEMWKQRISDGNGATIHIFYDNAHKNLSFFIETKKDELLPPDRRSQGLKWFLSFYLQLKSYNDDYNNLIILFDEPGLYLHSKAQEDMLRVFDEISKSHQILYTTHSPYLIDTENLNRVRLVLNTKEEGTTIEKITTGKIKNQKDALKPVIDAMGLSVAHNFSPITRKNVIVEGISDFYYFTALKKLIKNEEDFCFVPAMGASQSHLLMELCIGWGLEWLIIFDEKDSKKEFNRIKKAFFNDSKDEAKDKIHTLNGCDGIEDMFVYKDFKKVNEEISKSKDKKLSDLVNGYGGKELFARLFLEAVNNETIKFEDINNQTIKNFKTVFEFIKSKFQ